MRCTMMAIVCAVGAALTMPALAKAPIRPLVAPDRLPAAAAAMTMSPDGRRILIDVDGTFHVFDAETLRQIRVIGRPADVETIAGSGPDGSMIVELNNGREPTDRRRLIDAMTGLDIADVPADEDPLAVWQRPGASSWLIASHNGRYRDAKSMTGAHVLNVRRQGQQAPALSLELAATRQDTRTPKVIVAHDGKSFAIVHAQRAWLIDSSTFSAQKLELGNPSQTIATLAFTPDDARIVLVPQAGPLLVIDARTRQRLATIDAPPMARRYNATAHAGGGIIRIDGRRETAIVDAATGQQVQAARMSSGNSYVLNWIGPNLVLRAWFPRHGKTSTYGVYRHIAGTFKLAFRRERAGRYPIAASPNGGCLFVAGAQMTFRDLATDREIAKVEPSAQMLAAPAFTRDGKRLIATDQSGRLLAYPAPVSCHGSARQ